MTVWGERNSVIVREQDCEEREREREREQEREQG